jgi:hypothetical protein
MCPPSLQDRQFKPLIRPIWYFDIDVQGEGIVDTTIHLVDMISMDVVSRITHRL